MTVLSSHIFFKHCKDAVFLLDAAGCIGDANHSGMDLLGDNCLAGSFTERLAELAGAPGVLHYRIKERDYALDHTELENGESFVVLRDMTDMLKAQSESEQRFQVMADSAPVMIWMARLDKLCDWFNEPWLRFTGRTLQQEWGNGWAEGVHPDDFERCLKIYSEAFDARREFSMDYRLRRRDGVYRWILDNGAPRYDLDGVFTGFIGSCTDIHERKELEDLLLTQTNALKAADVQKDKFLALLSHELRNPLAPIVTAAGLLKHIEHKDDSLAKIRAIVERQGGYLKRLIDELLDVSRMTQGKIKLEKTHTTLDYLVRHALEMVQQQFDKNRNAVELRLPAGAVPFYADEGRLTQVIVSLLENASKYSPPGSAIVISAEMHGELTRISVKDEGEGIAPAFLPHLFELFAQAEQGLSRSKGGLGVGLMIARSLARLHGGDLVVQATAPGVGSEFCLTIPHQHHPRAPQAAPGGAPDGMRYRILLVEDNEDARTTLQMLLEMQGHSVAAAADATQALALAGPFDPQIILCDIGLPEMDGYELARRLKSLLAGRTTVMAALTGYGRPEDRRNAAEAGFDTLLVKPILLEQLETFLHQQRLVFQDT